MNRPVLTVALRTDHDVVMARQRARQIAAAIGFDGQEQVRIATAVSELARNASRYAGGGRVEFLAAGPPPELLCRVTDHGPGIADLRAVLDGRYVSTTGMGLGLIGTRRLMDTFEIDSSPGRGTTVTIGKRLPPGAPPFDGPASARLGDELARQLPQGPFEEVQRQNQELLAALAELEQRRADLERLNGELEDTNRGVVALYAELDERADILRRASEMKSSFLADMSHEFRTPLGSIRSIGQMLMDRIDGDLTEEQEKQVRFILRAAEGLTELVDDLLDLAKVESGKAEVRPTRFDIGELFGALRGMLKPLLSANAAVALVFEDAPGLPDLHTDEGKVSQILRNFISNALKFTESGEVRVRAEAVPDATVVFSVLDTGVGIAAADLERIFHEFATLDTPRQRRVKGTGLGLPLCRKLATLLGGRVEVRSEAGVGSVFSLIIPREFAPA